MIDYTIDPSATRDESEETEDFFSSLNQALEDGSMKMEIDENGEFRLYAD